MTSSESDALCCFLPRNWVESLKDVPFFGGQWLLVDVDKDFIEFLQTDGLFSFDEERSTVPSKWSDDEEEWSSSSALGDEAVAHSPQMLFPELHERIKAVVAALKGSVVPKLNWTVPKDAVWISANTLKCTSAYEIYQLLKASDRIQSDIRLAEACAMTQHSLLLRPFVEAAPELEFRCFVVDAQLVAVGQKNLEVFNEGLRLNKSRMLDHLKNFWRKLSKRLPMCPSALAFDACFDAGLDECMLVDISPLTDSTATGLFSFSEVKELASSGDPLPAFRTVESHSETQMALANRNCLPVDLLSCADTNICNVDFNQLQ